MFGKKAKRVEFQYDPTKQKAVMRCSICTGERVAGFKDLETGHFTEVMVIRNDAELENFKKKYNVERVEKIY